MNPDAHQQITQFLDYLSSVKRNSVHTVDNYQRDLNQLAAFCLEKQLSDWKAIKNTDIRQYISKRHRQGISSRSLQRQLSSFRSFYRYLIKYHHYTENPANDIRAPKQTKKLPKALDVDQMSGMLDASADSILETRDVAMFELFYSSGLRLSELAGLDIGDVDLQQGMVLVRQGKGNKQRLVPVGSKALQALNKWLAHRHSSTSALFTNQNGGRLGQRSIQMRLDRWCKKIGLPEHVHPHMLRHSFASHLLESSGDIRAVQELLGHDNINSTQIYTHLDFQHLSAVYDQAHPRAKKK